MVEPLRCRLAFLVFLLIPRIAWSGSWSIIDWWVSRRLWIQAATDVIVAFSLSFSASPEPDQANAGAPVKVRIIGAIQAAFLRSSRFDAFSSVKVDFLQNGSKPAEVKRCSACR